MSKQSSLITFTGKMDGISFYKKNGVHLARKANGPSRARILTDPNFARTRENLSEFGGLALAVSSFTQMLAPVKNLRDAALRGRVIKILRSMTKRDQSGVRGQRSIAVSVNRELLQHVELNSTLNLSTAFAAKFSATHSADRTKGTISFNNMEVNSVLSAPTVATHFRLVQLIGVMSDIVYDVNLQKYSAADALNNSIQEVAMTDYLPVNGGEPVSLALEATLAPAAVLGERVSVVQCLGILFFEKLGTAYYPLTQGKAMKIVDVF